jgi:hypothetical protein
MRGYYGRISENGNEPPGYMNGFLDPWLSKIALYLGLR